MEIGMLWFDDSPHSLSEKVRVAVDYYSQKYGREPTLCLINPAMLDAEEGIVAGIQVRSARSVMPHHFWIGVDDPPLSKMKPKKDGRAKKTRTSKRAIRRPALQKSQAA